MAPAAAYGLSVEPLNNVDRRLPVRNARHDRTPKTPKTPASLSLTMRCCENGPASRSHPRGRPRSALGRRLRGLRCLRPTLRGERLLRRAVRLLLRLAQAHRRLRVSQRLHRLLDGKRPGSHLQPSPVPKPSHQRQVGHRRWRPQPTTRKRWRKSSPSAAGSSSPTVSRR